MSRKSRLDASGKSTSRSQYQIQTYVNQHKAVFQRELSLLFGDSGLELTWLSPLAEDSYREYWDKRALTRLGLEQASACLSGVLV
jgi:hypothetical protein